MSKSIKLVVTVYVITLVLWLAFVFLSGNSATYEGPLFSYILKPFLVGMTILPLIGGLIGINNSKHWGGWSSVMGRGLFGLGLGMVAWSGGMVIWNYYLFFTDIQVPYPSAADAIFILSWPLWTYGLVHVSKITGSKFALREKLGRVILTTIPIVIIIFSYYLLFEVARSGLIELGGGAVKLFFDLFYPIGDVVILTITVLIYNFSRRYLGGIYKTPILLLLVGFVFNYISDFIFSFTTTNETYFNGHIVDILFTTTMFILALALAMLDVKRLNQPQAK